MTPSTPWLESRALLRRRRGAILVYAALTLVLLIGLLGLALDTALVRTTGQELQRAADAAALAGTEVLETGNEGNLFSPVRLAAIGCALANEAANAGVQILANDENLPTGDIVVGRWDQAARSFDPDTSEPNAVQVTARRTGESPGGALELMFGGIFGSGYSSIARTAIASRGNATGPAVVLVLDPAMAQAFDMRGNSVMLASSGAIQVNSAHGSQAFYLNGAPGVARARAKAIHVTGVSDYPAGATSPIPVDGSPPIPDPLADLPYPDPATMTDYGSISGPGNYSPGYYPGGVDVSGGQIFLDPGIYYFGAPGIYLNADAVIYANGAMLFLEQGADFQISGATAGIELFAPASGTYQGVALFAHRLSTATFNISGSGVFELHGTMYLAGAHLEMDGNVDREIGRIIVNSLQFRGNGIYHISGEGHPEEIPLYTYLVK